MKTELVRTKVTFRADFWAVWDAKSPFFGPFSLTLIRVRGQKLALAGVAISHDR